MMPPTALQRLGGVARTRSLYHLGVAKSALRHAVNSGTIARPRTGIYCLDPTSPLAIAAVHGGRLGCVSALGARGIWVLTGADTVHVSLPNRGRAHHHDGCRCVEHWRGSVAGLGLVPLPEALVQAAFCIGEEGFFAALESALHQRMISSQQRAWIRNQLPKRLRWLVDFAGAQSESGLESLFRLRMHLLGVILQPQVSLAGIGRVDFLIGDLIIELDGRENHAGQDKRHKDLLRDAAAARAGYRVLRFNYALVVHNWDVVAATVLAAIR